VSGRDLATLGVAAGVAFAGTWIARRAALRAGKLDVPSDRSSHARPTPRTGGFGIAAGFFLAGLLFASRRSGRGSPDALLLGAALFFAVGALDDLFGLRARWKLLLQAAAAAAPVAMGLRLGGAAWGAWPGFDLGVLSAAATWLFVLAVVNVVNFMDGIDVITSATAVVVLGGCALSTGDAEVASHLYGAAGAVVGFVPWNVPPARTFMGDGGSHLLGFLAAGAALSGPGGLSPGTAPWPMVVAALLPSFVDVAGGLVRKARAGIPLAQAHNDHRYQRLVKAGRGHGAVALRYGLLAAALAACAGPVADRLGPAGAAGAAALLLGLHLAEAARATARVPRLARAPIPAPRSEPAR
jgi:UDP-GlcNAc:undecaprenyl-phosphate GlcNAc-1-phosphate transferase